MIQSLSPKSLAEAIGVSESSVKRWVDQGHLVAVRTAGGHRRILRNEALRYIRVNRLPIVRPDRLDLPASSASASGKAASGEPDDVFYDALVEGGPHDAAGLLLRLYLEGHTVAALCDEVVYPAMTRVGTLWHDDEGGVIVEHRATSACLGALAEVRRALPPPAPGLCAVGGAPSGDPYLLGSLAAATVLAAEGYHAINLGPETPIPLLARAAAMYDARLVWVSVTAAHALDALGAQLRELAGAVERVGGLLALGGRLVGDVDVPDGGNVFVGKSMGELAAFARGVVNRVPLSGAART